jgi:hypothetical protein
VVWNLARETFSVRLKVEVGPMKFAREASDVEGLKVTNCSARDREQGHLERLTATITMGSRRYMCSAVNERRLRV